MAYKQDAGRDNLTNLNIAALTNGGGDPPTKSLRSTVYDANRLIQEVKDNPVPLSKPAERLANPELSSFRFRGSSAYEDAVLPKGESRKTGDVVGGFNPEGVDKKYPYLSSRLNTNPSIKDFKKRNTTKTMRSDAQITDYNDNRTYADIDKSEQDTRARESFNVTPALMKEAEKGAKTSFKISQVLANSQVSGSESDGNEAITKALQMRQDDKYLRSHSAYIKRDGQWEKNDAIKYENDAMMNRYIKKFNYGIQRQDNADTFRNVGQDLQKARTNNKFSLNSNNSSNSQITANNLFKNQALTTDITSGKKRFKF
tara:strand:+ start:207 stop:1148 length:942 start_codon:yes stop_codon:yes gene_type:complete